MSDARSAAVAFLRAAWTPAALVAALLAVVVVASALGAEGGQVAITEMLIRVVVVIGIYVFAGNSGILSFGHIGFMCIGAYAAGWAACDPEWKGLMLTGLPAFLAEHRYPMPVAVLGSAALGGVAATLFGMAITRLSGIAASIATFAFLVIVNSVYANWDTVTAGTSSMVGIPAVVGPWTSLLFAAIAIVVAYLFQISGYGLMLRASRDDAVAAASSGVDIRRLRLIAFGVSGAIVGAAGGVYAHFLGILTTDTFYLDLTFITIAMLIIGGIGSLTGAVVGVLFITLVIEVLRALEAGVTIGGAAIALPHGAQEVGLGVLMALVLIFRPQGIMGGQEVPSPFPPAGSGRLRAGRIPESENGKFVEPVR
ncbi:amino acid/amide ABC transporter membrane protein 2 (HAAT family) [Roseiarcus fermentans]|uniref:Amino acid/amide ABC transporter membrane protein 2 (HAAT family) n=1 Tax=Roseiarcus fermentans TaxID=1473586 RepID=A0A366FHC4_9HYPH|nr:branched-chain amino acid ABC transporter permease [Roseiarcus fermentans]RBP14001.1 amino acid/amide ABC transporter membrane protein 2 (HAAT family) [Roseiarcus fermentans]